MLLHTGGGFEVGSTPPLLKRDNGSDCKIMVVVYSLLDLAG